MAHLFNNIDLITYGIEATKCPDSNITVKGGFDLPARMGKTGYRWDDEDGVEPYVLQDELFFGGRDIESRGFIMGTRATVKSGLLAFGTALSAVSGTAVFATPYGNYNVYAKKVEPIFFSMGAEIKMVFREPAPVLTGGSIPASGSSPYTLDGIPFSTLGLRLSPLKEVIEFPEAKEMYFTKIQAEGWRNSFRKEREFNFEAILLGTTLANFQSRVRGLYAIFMQAGLRTIVLNNEMTVQCYAPDGFSFSNVYMMNIASVTPYMIGKLKAKLTVTSLT